MLPRMCAKVLKARADQLVFEQGLTESREQAKRLIMAGEVQVAVPEGSQTLPVAVDKPGHIYPAGTRFQLTAREQYVSRGAYKLLTIMDAFHLDVQNWVCLDAGASTGGFTDCLLQHGAARVYAVDVGHNQLHEKLKADARVVNLEGVNLRAAPPSLIPEEVDLVVADVSFIANRKELVRHLVDVCRPGDLLITQGAGDITAIGPAFIAAKQEAMEGGETA